MRELLRRRLGAVVMIALLLVLVLGRRVASLAVDLWWYDVVGYREVFTSILWTRLVTGVVAAVLLGVLVAVNLHIARKMRPLFLPETPQQAQVERYRELVDPYLPWIIVGISALFATSSGFALSREWETVMLWRNGVTVGVTDPQFARDVGYYLFDLPLWSMLQDWLLTTLVLTTMLTVGAHYLLGGIRPENPGDKILPNVKAHLSGLFALVLAVWAWGYYLDRFLLNYSPRGTVTGASYTDVNAELRALEILLVMSVVSIALVLYNIRKRGFLLPGSAVGLLLVGSIFLQGAYPAAIQRLQVEPQELTREAPFIQRNLDATRAAYGLDQVELRPFEVANDLTAAQAAENQATLVNIRLWDDAILATTYAELQALRPYYRFNDVDVDRYVIDGQLRQVMLSTRDLRQEDLPAAAQNWQNQTLTYTHGFGVVASQVNTATEDGQPVFIARDIPPTGSPELIADEAPGIYYGDEGSPTYNIVNTDQEELDYEEPVSQQQVTTRYSGLGGVELSSFARRVAFALEFGDTNILLSNLIRDESRLLRLRDVSERVAAVAPYLTLDEDPYPVVLDGRVQWVQDAYTVSRWYPYAEYGLLEAEGGSLPVNYVRNSVKAVVDAYDGTVSLFTVDTTDPLLQAWSAAFPASYQPMSAMPDGLEEHFRYPQDMFELQAKIYAEYHIPGVDAFFSKADLWDIPPDAAAVQNNPTSAAAPELEPYYLLMRLPGETEEEFVLIQPYLASNRPNMVAWLAARSDPGHYGELYAVQFPSDSEVLGMAQAQTRIEQEEEISTYITLLSQQGSQVIRGNMIVLPIERSILYVEPLFIQGGQSKIPELSRVVVVMGNRVVFEETLAEAIATLVGGTMPTLPPVTGEPVTPDVDADPELLQRSLEAFADAQTALARGDLGEYQRLVQEARRLVEAALQGRTAADVAAEESAEAASEAQDASGVPADSASQTPSEG
ncbi:MAG: uncharacterized membrane protein (UPF0182 family) [Nitriliruptoraceae bacterium]